MVVQRKKNENLVIENQMSRKKIPRYLLIIISQLHNILASNHATNMVRTKPGGKCMFILRLLRNRIILNKPGILVYPGILRTFVNILCYSLHSYKQS